MQFEVVKKVSQSMTQNNADAIFTIERNLQVMRLLNPIERGSIQELVARTVCH
jgi:hypothetical protein